MINEPSGTGVDPIRLLVRRYLGALAAVVLLLAGEQVLVLPDLSRLAVDAPVINIAGRQRMLSQRLAKAALLADRASRAEDHQRAVAELEDTVRTWSATHEELRRRGLPGGRPGRNSAAVREAFTRLQPAFDRMRDAADRIVRSSVPERPALAAILESEGDYLARMDRIVGLYEQEMRVRVATLVATGWFVTVLIAAALVGIGLFVLWPAARLIGRQLLALGQAREVLEERVRARTLELEEASRRHREVLELFSHAARTNTLGEMASGLAHELNQPLGAVANYAEGCLVALTAPEPDLAGVRQALERILATTLRAGEVLKRIRGFVKRHGPEQVRFEPNRVVEEAVALLGDDVRRRAIGLKVDLAPHLPWVEGDPVQIQQVLVNLVRNALEAVTTPKPLEPTVVVQTRADPSGGVRFLVTDCGEGIPAEHLGRIFDAYFSTRAEGMGMGLAICRTIVEAHGGVLSVSSKPGVETTFQFTLPAAGPE
jgi:two-component system sensor kinase FixL